MKKFLTGLALVIGLGAGGNLYSQSSPSSAREIPAVIKTVAKKYLGYVKECENMTPEIKLVEEYVKDFNHDGIEDRKTLYALTNTCDWPNIPSYFVYTELGRSDGSFAEYKDPITNERVVSKIWRDGDFKPLKKPEDWWK